jgi:hypothetical protein
MTKPRQRKRKIWQAEFVTDEEQRLLEIEDMQLVVKFGEKKRYSDLECDGCSGAEYGAISPLWPASCSA